MRIPRRSEHRSSAPSDWGADLERGHPVREVEHDVDGAKVDPEGRRRWSFSYPKRVRNWHGTGRCLPTFKNNMEVEREDPIGL